LTFVKLGEEAHVDLASFHVDGARGKKFRHALHRLERAHAGFRVLAVEEVRGRLEELRAISDDWLERHAGAEKGFSLGFFSAGYITRFRVAVIEQDGSIVAFANLWEGARQEELSLDLMRYDARAPKEVMEALLVHVMLWGKDQGFRRFMLGMAPLSGFESSPAAPLWSRLASFVYRHGEPIYRFQGLRAFKQKFDPEWRPRYLAYPGGLRLPRVLADVAALIAGGYRRIFLK
jgi:phosphatidylglycerol lysyltransferase